MSPIAAAQSRFAGITPCALKNPLEPSSPCSEKPIIISSSTCSFERDSRHQCLKSKSFFLKLNLKLIMVSYLSVSHLTQVIHDFLSCVSQETAHYENVTVRLCTIHCCVCHVKTSLEEQESSERASTKLSIAQAPDLPYAENSSPMLATSIAWWSTSIAGYLYRLQINRLISVYT